MVTNLKMKPSSWILIGAAPFFAMLTVAAFAVYVQHPEITGVLSGFSFFMTFIFVVAAAIRQSDAER